MLRRVVISSLVVVSVSSVGCQLVADFEKEDTAASGRDAGGKGNRGGNTSLTGNATMQNAAGSGATTNAGSMAKPPATSSGAGTNGVLASSGGAGGVGAATVTTAVGNGGSATTAIATKGGATAAETNVASSGGTGAIATSATTVTASGGATSTGGTVNATGGVATAGTTATQPEDTTPPTVTSISPLNGTRGVTADTTISLNFSEPMNKGSVASALTVTGLVASDLNLQWNVDATSVTITPTAGLQYATGTSSSGTTAKTYTTTVGTGARDSTGNAMTTAFSSSFTTLKRVTWVVSTETVLASDTYTYPTHSCAEPLKIGTWRGSVSSGFYIAYIVFDVASLDPASAMYAIESAKVFGYQKAATGNFYSLGAVDLTKIQYWPQLYNIQSYDVIADVGILSSSDTPASVSIEALTSFKRDFVSNGATKHMYKLAPIETSGSSSSEQAANFTCDGFHLDITYLIQ